MKKLLVLIFSLVIFSFSFAEWKYEDYSDPVVSGGGDKLFVRNSDKNTRFTILDFESRATGRFIEFTLGVKTDLIVTSHIHDDMNMFIVVDQGKRRKFQGIDVSADNGEISYSKILDKEVSELFKDMKKGNKLTIEIVSSDGSKFTSDFSLKGFTKALNQSYRLNQ